MDVNIIYMTGVSPCVKHRFNFSKRITITEVTFKIVTERYSVLLLVHVDKNIIFYRIFDNICQFFSTFLVNTFFVQFFTLIPEMLKSMISDQPFLRFQVPKSENP